jgi:hypothetical protein
VVIVVDDGGGDGAGGDAGGAGEGAGTYEEEDAGGETLVVDAEVAELDDVVVLDGSGHGLVLLGEEYERVGHAEVVVLHIPEHEVLLGEGDQVVIEQSVSVMVTVSVVVAVYVSSLASRPFKTSTVGLPTAKVEREMRINEMVWMRLGHCQNGPLYLHI